jgi:phage-related protein
MDEYKVVFFYDPDTGKVPVREYLDNLSLKERAKISKYIEFLRENKGVLDEPYTKHIRDKIRELRIDFGKKRHRVFFFTFVGKNIILLHAFQKHTAQTPEREIIQAQNNYHKVINNPKLYA